MREKISALLDEELAQHEWQSALSRIRSDADLKETWQRYHIIRSVVRQEPLHHNPDLTDKIAQRIAAEPQPDSPSRATLNFPRTPRWLPGLAVAASVAGFAAFGFSYWPRDEGATAGQTVAANTGMVNIAATKWNAATPELENTLNGFLVEHGEFTPMSGMNGLTTYARFVSYDSAE